MQNSKLRARSIQPKFWLVRPGKVVHLKRWTTFFDTFLVGWNRSIQFWTEISENFGWMDIVPLRYAKGVPFVNRRYMKGVPVYQKWYLNLVWAGHRGKASPLVEFPRVQIYYVRMWENIILKARVINYIQNSPFFSV